jgi:hypothetical protein
MEIVFRESKKSVVMEVMESYRKLPSYQEALEEIYCVLFSDYKPNNRCRRLDLNDCHLFYSIVNEVKKMRLRIQELENAKRKADDSGDNSPNP